MFDLGFETLVKATLCSVCGVDSGFNLSKNGLYPYTNIHKEKCKAQRLSCSHVIVYSGNSTQRSQQDYRKIMPCARDRLTLVSCFGSLEENACRLGFCGLNQFRKL